MRKINLGLPFFIVTLLLMTIGLAVLDVTPVKAAQEVAPPFRDYYNNHQGIRVLGYPLSGLIQVNGYDSQFFEKGRIEDHSKEVSNPAWKFMYGRLSAELMENNIQSSVNSTSMTYADLKKATDPGLRQVPPPGYTGGVMKTGDGFFIPFDSYLRAERGYIVPAYFWNYMNRSDLFPGGWLHDIGLPMTNAFSVETIKFGMHRTILTQAFERSVLTYDPLNPPEWQIERGNIGTDAYQSIQWPQQIQIPVFDANVTVPVHILARLGQPGEQMRVTLRWADNTQLTRVMSVIKGEDGKGLLIGNLDWGAMPPSEPPTQAATLEIRNQGGVLLAQQPLKVFSPNDPATQEMLLYWVVTTDTVGVQPLKTHVLKTTNAPFTALQELLWGPPAPTNIGFSTALPTPNEVLSYPGRTASWGARVLLRSLNIDNGMATADFSQELKAYGGGSLRVNLIRDQITQTLTQFSNIKTVKITIEGQSEGVLEP
ncbi:MAG TPA: GerMN domain-containing protein [Chloroflexia bacterium]|nr:GerMN domain-containing protein [Chloroflexia bacterium]